jgi:hypothetical protein
MRDSIVPTDAIEPSLNNWHRIQTIRRRTIRRNHPPRIIRHINRNRRGKRKRPRLLRVQSTVITAVISSITGKRFGATAPRQLINVKYRHYGGNINGLQPSGEHPDLISGFKNLRKLQAGGISLIETNIE